MTQRKGLGKLPYLENEEIAASAQEPAPVNADQLATPPKGKPKRKPLPGHLPRNEITLGEQ